MDTVSIARTLNRGGVSAFPLRRVPALSIYSADDTENFDVDLIGPTARQKIATTLQGAGWTQRTGRSFENQAQPGFFPPILYPKPSFVLGADPADAVLKLVDKSAGVLLITPTQALLAYCHRLKEELGQDDRRELVDLVREQPANLEKVAGGLRFADYRSLFHTMLPELLAAQQQGIAERQSRTFVSALPR